MLEHRQGCAVVLVKYGPGIMYSVKNCFEVVAPLIHLGVDFCGCVGVGLSMIDRLVAKFDYQALDLGMANKELEEH